MGKHEPMSAKAIAIRIKAKGLQKLKYYCEMCKKQCRDDNGFKCHIQSESHRRQALIVAEDTGKFVDQYSQEFLEGFMYLVKTRYRSKKVLANTVFQDYIKDRQHTHMNSTRWTTLTEFANWLADKGMVTTEDSERGVMITYIDRDPELLRRKELEAQREQRAKEEARQNEIEVKQQMAALQSILKSKDVEKEPAEPIPFVKVATDEIRDKTNENFFKEETDRPHQEDDTLIENDSAAVIEKPLFNVRTFSIAPKASSSFKPPPPKRKVLRKGPDTKKIKQS